MRNSLEKGDRKKRLELSKQERGQEVRQSLSYISSVIFIDSCFLNSSTLLSKFHLPFAKEQNRNQPKPILISSKMLKSRSSIRILRIINRLSIHLLFSFKYSITCLMINFCGTKKLVDTINLLLLTQIRMNRLANQSIRILLSKSVWEYINLWISKQKKQMNLFWIELLIFL